MATETQNIIVPDGMIAVDIGMDEWYDYHVCQPIVGEVQSWQDDYIISLELYNEFCEAKKAYVAAIKKIQAAIR